MQAKILSLPISTKIWLELSLRYQVTSLQIRGSSSQDVHHFITGVANNLDLDLAGVDMTMVSASTISDYLIVHRIIGIIEKDEEGFYTLRQQEQPQPEQHQQSQPPPPLAPSTFIPWSAFELYIIERLDNQSWQNIQILAYFEATQVDMEDIRRQLVEYDSSRAPSLFIWTTYLLTFHFLRRTPSSFSFPFFLFFFFSFCIYFCLLFQLFL